MDLRQFPRVDVKIDFEDACDLLKDSAYRNNYFAYNLLSIVYGAVLSNIKGNFWKEIQVEKILNSIFTNTSYQIHEVLFDKDLIS